MEEVKFTMKLKQMKNLKPTPRAGFMCGWWCYSGFLCPGGNACN